MIALLTVRLSWSTRLGTIQTSPGSCCLFWTSRWLGCILWWWRGHPYRVPQPDLHSISSIQLWSPPYCWPRLPPERTKPACTSDQYRQLLSQLRCLSWRPARGSALCFLKWYSRLGKRTANSICFSVEWKRCRASPCRHFDSRYRRTLAVVRSWSQSLFWWGWERFAGHPSPPSSTPQLPSLMWRSIWDAIGGAHDMLAHRVSYHLESEA